LKSLVSSLWVLVAAARASPVRTAPTLFDGARQAVVSTVTPIR
jgi:hypothetical protein